MLLAVQETITTTQEPDMDWPIFVTALIVSAFNRSALIIAVWLVLNIALGSVVSDAIGWYWKSMTLWAALFWIKDMAFMAISGMLLYPISITLGFAATCLFHQVTSWQINTYNWENITLFDYRSDFMLYLSVIMLATAIIDIRSGNGGKRVRNTLFRSDGLLGGVLHHQAQKVRL
jgi:hypothetical protein